MAKVLSLRFRKEDGTGSKTISIPSPVADIGDKTALLEGNMTTYVEGKIPDYTKFDEARTIETTTTELLDLVDA